MLELAPVRVIATRRGDAIYLDSGHPLGEPPRRLADVLARAAADAPERTFLAERLPSGALREIGYAQALATAEAIAARLIDRPRPDRPVLVLSGNGIDHALLTLAGYIAGVPVAPLSVAYSLLSRDHAKLRHIAAKLDPSLVYVQSRASFEAALAAVDEATGRAVPTLTSDDDGTQETIAAWSTAPSSEARARLSARRAEVGPDTVAKILFTSGSTDFPKGVLNTHRMLTSNQQMIAQLWPFLEREPPIMVDWLPWSHTFGGNHNLHMAMFHGGTMLIDEGKPSPALVERTIANLRAMPPTLYFNVPAGFAALVPHLEHDRELCEIFFSRLRLIFYAGAALPDDLWQRLVSLARSCTDDPPLMTTAWGSTETSPLSTSTHFPTPRAGNIGVPAPGVSLKLVPNADKLEVRVRGPHVMPGYLDEPALTEAAFDEEGYYRIGDAVKLEDPEDPAAGLRFDGRVAEDFKLTTGTWINVGRLRTGVLSACSPALRDVVVAGHDRDALGLLVWPDEVGCRALCGEALPADALARDARVRAHLRESIAWWNREHPQRSTRIERVLVLVEPPSIDAGEITDKGYVNQRVVLGRRHHEVARLFGDEAEVLRPSALDP